MTEKSDPTAEGAFFADVMNDLYKNAEPEAMARIYIDLTTRDIYEEVVDLQKFDPLRK